MEERIAVLERDVNAIKSELAVIRSTYWMREDAKELDNRVSHIEFELGDIKADIAVMKADIAQLKLDVAQLKSDVAQLKSDLAHLQADVAQPKADMATLKMDLAALKLRFDSELPHLATKADLYKLEARMKAWGIGLALSVITINAGVNFAMYSSLKSQLLAHTAVQGGPPPLAPAAAAARR